MYDTKRMPLSPVPVPPIIFDMAPPHHDDVIFGSQPPTTLSFQQFFVEYISVIYVSRAPSFRETLPPT